jgi:hypothetical protein
MDIYAEQWRPLTPVIFDDRSPENLQKALLQFGVASSLRYRPTAKDTYCNIFRWDATRALGVEVPHWHDLRTGTTTAVGKGVEMRANMVEDWMRRAGVAQGWREVDKRTAYASAALGLPVVLNQKGVRSGHEALLMPDGLCIQAGRVCGIYPVDAVFLKAPPITYWLHA